MSTQPQPVTCNDCSEKQGTTLSIRTLAKTFALNTYALRCTGHLHKTIGEVSVLRFSARIRPEPQSTTTESWEHRCMEHFKPASGATPVPLTTHRPSLELPIAEAESSVNTVDRSTCETPRAKHLSAPSGGTLQKEVRKKSGAASNAPDQPETRNERSGKFEQHGRSEHRRFDLHMIQERIHSEPLSLYVASRCW